jgi:hypothetical protein
VAQKNVQTHAKRDRENALREKRERKQQKKADRAAARRATGDVEVGSPREQHDEPNA